jgi:transcriptional regulator with XRE-family HTH domain
VTDENTKLAARVRAARAFANVTQTVVADRLGVSTMTVKVMEKGSRDFAREDLEAIADLCGVPLDFLLHGFHAVAEVSDSETRVIIEATRQVAHEALARIDDRFDELGELLSSTTAEAIAERTVSRLRPRRPDRERSS